MTSGSYGYETRESPEEVDSFSRVAKGGLHASSGASLSPGFVLVFA